MKLAEILALIATVTLGLLFYSWVFGGNNDEVYM